MSVYQSFDWWYSEHVGNKVSDHPKIIDFEYDQARKNHRYLEHQRCLAFLCEPLAVIGDAIMPPMYSLIDKKN